MTEMLTDRYHERLAGTLSCYDRIVITGTLPGACYAAGMTSFLNARHIRIFDYARFAEPLREQIRAGAQALATAQGAQIEHIAKTHIRKEGVVAAVIKRRGDHPGLVHVLSAMEACNAYEPWHDKRTHQTFLRHTSGKCLHYYFYFIDDTLGLIYLRVPTWCPFRLQFYCNGHSWLARSLATAGIGYTMADNAFIRLDDWARAQQLADAFSPDTLHAILDRYAEQCCPVFDVFGQSYHWSLMQVEYATDLAFRSDAVMKPLYEELSRQAIFSVKAEQVATFLGKKITPQLAQEIGSRFATRIEGTCVKHYLGKVSVKMYDKFGRVLRLETTTNDVSFFKHHRKVEHRDGHQSREIAPLKKSIYSLIDLREILLGCNRRYLEYLSALDDFSAGDRNLQRLTSPKTVDGHTLKGFNFFDRTQQTLLRALQRPAFNIRGLRRADLARFLPHVSPSGMTRYLWRLRQFGLIKKVAHSYRYYLTRLGRSAIAAACRITEHTIVPALAGKAT
ncbi:MarR family transcriptional regulator [Accumulibacter sp.]|uniref:MarR family transcriptional regulator n=1 Tax=Accumulibacter sp. TaxID=2053492 RepID=UPI0026241FAA|nr:MarR family transcriptional regulator [Accumulibacter sp.]